MGNEQQKQQKIAEYQRQQALAQQNHAAQVAAQQKQQERNKAAQMEIKSEQTVQGLNGQIVKIDDLIRKK